MNENRISWARFDVFLSISSALITLWASLTNLGFLSDLGQLLSGLLGFLVAVVWLFVAWKAHAYNDLWVDRLRKIEKEKEFSGILKTYDEDREKQFMKTRLFWEKHPRLDNLRPFIPYTFACFWLVLLAKACYAVLSVDPLWVALFLLLIPPPIAASLAAYLRKRLKAKKT